jgi:IPT/TIG domain-containing protein
MRMTSARIGKNFAPLRLLAVLVFLPLFAPLCHAQCFDGASGGGVYAIISPSHFAPGQSYNASVTVPSGGFNPDTECPTPAVLYIVNAASYGQGDYYQEDSFVTVSNLAYVSTTEITFTVTVASNAPTETDAYADISGDGAGGVGGSVWLVSNLLAVSITPCALAVTPTITSIQPTVFPAGAATPITITGTGFMPTTNANSCAPTTPYITAGTENVALSNINVVSPTEITLAATPLASDPSEAASVTAANYSLNGPPYYLNSNSAPAQISSCAVPSISSISPDTVLVGSTGVQLTITGSCFGSSPTVNVPSGVTLLSGQSSTNSTIIVSVKVSVSAPIGANSITVSTKVAGGGKQTSNQGAFTLDGPFYMMVVDDNMGFCDTCSTTVERFVTYQVMNFSNSPTGTIPIGESFTQVAGWTCTQRRPGNGITLCSGGDTTLSDGEFIDGWSLNSDAYTPKGCGETGNNVDHWEWCATGNSIGKLTGGCLTNAVSINGFVNPPAAMPKGKVINP